MTPEVGDSIGHGAGQVQAQRRRLRGLCDLVAHSDLLGQEQRKGKQDWGATGFAVDKIPSSLCRPTAR